MEPGLPELRLRSLRIPGSRLRAQEFADPGLQTAGSGVRFLGSRARAQEFAVPGLQSAGSGVCGCRAPDCGLRSLRIPGSRVGAQELLAAQDLPGPVTCLVSSALQGAFLITAPPGRP